jgi:conjugative transfer region protein (TIGR03748 family)
MSSVIHPLIYLRQLTAILGACLILGGCSSMVSQQAETAVVASSQPATSNAQPAIRASRYALVSVIPTTEQKDLLSQVIDIRIPDSFAPTVQDAMTYALRRSGYQLCAGQGDAARLFTHPLPAAHFRLGPVPLRDALQMLAGPAWSLEVDELNRSVCFGTRAEFRRPVTVPAMGERQ